MDEEKNEVYRPIDSVLAPHFIRMMKNSVREGTNDVDTQLQEILRRRGRRPVSIEQLLQGIRTGLTLAPADDDTNNARDDGGGERERGRVIVTNRFNQTVAVPISAVSESLPPVGGSLSEYFIGPEFEELLKNLPETDPNRYGTPPVPRKAVEALVDVVHLSARVQCLVCLDYFQAGSFGKDMDCGHSFHSYCLHYWLELHGSCPVCRCQLGETIVDENSDQEEEGPIVEENSD